MLQMQKKRPSAEAQDCFLWSIEEPKRNGDQLVARAIQTPAGAKRNKNDDQTRQRGPLRIIVEG